MPVSNSFPGWVVPETQNATMFELQIVVDLLCSDCRDENKIMKELYDKPFLDKKVKDYVKVLFTPTVLGYHLYSF